MRSILNTMKNFMLYNGLTKEQYHAIKGEINEHNRRMLVIFSLLILGAFLPLTVLSFGFGIFYHNRYLYLISMLVSCVLFVISKKAHFERSDMYTILGHVWTAFFVGISILIAIEPASVTERTTLYLAFPLIAPMILCLPSISFSIETIVLELLYLYLISQYQIQYDVYMTNLANSIVFLAISIVMGNVTMNIKARGMYHAYENLRYDEISELNKELEEALRAQEKQLDIVKALSSHYENVYYIHRNLRMVNIIKLGKNNVSERFHEAENGLYPYDEVCEFFLRNVVHKGDKEELKHMMDFEKMAQMVDEERVIERTYRITEAGQKHNYLIRFRKLETSEDIICGVQNIDELVAKEMEHQKTLQEQYDIFNALTEDYVNVYKLNLLNGEMTVFEHRHRTVYGVKALDHLHMYSYSDVMEEYIEKRVHPEDKEMAKDAFDIEVVRRKLEKNGEYSFSYRTYYEGIMHYVATRFAIIHKDETTFQIIFGFRIIDAAVEKEKELQAVLEDALIAAKQANNAKTTFLFNMSHDIRTPMNAILGFANLMEKSMDNQKKIESYIHKIKESGTILLSILNSVLEMARIEKGTLEIEEEACQIEQVADSVYAVFQEQMKEKDIDFDGEINVEDHYIYCDVAKIQEIFLNIISNAYKYTSSGGRVKVSLEQMPYHEEGYALYQAKVMDTGIGMSPEFQKRIFDEFSRERNSVRNSIEGTGLGMAIVKRLVDFMDGMVEVNSEVGKGTTFIVRIPFRVAKQEDIPKDFDFKKEMNKLVGKRILLAEDNDINAEIAKGLLKKCGIEVDRVENGQLCYERIERQEAMYYDIILMDIQMPVLDGYEATKRIRSMDDRQKANIPIIAMTANAFAEDKKAAIDCGMNAHLGKPIVVEEMMRTIIEVLDKRFASES